jgi:hypothetical protein
VTRQALDELRDHVYILECAIEDVGRDVADDDSPATVRRALEWLLEAARPLVSTRILGEG